MQIALTPEQDALRAELREYFAAWSPRNDGRPWQRPRATSSPAAPAARGRSGGEFGDAGVYKDVIREIGHDGWLGIGWPEEWGGQNRSMMDQLIFTDEAAIAGVPIPYLTLNTVGPTIMRFGTDSQKQDMLPKILKGELHFSIGYSEPGSGTDLASLQHARAARGRRVGDQRPEDVDLADPVRRLHLAGLPHRPRPAPPQGALDDPGARGQPRVLLHPGAHRRGRGDERDLLRGRAGAAGEPRRRAQRRLGADDQPAEPRTRGAHLGRAGHPLDRRW